MINNIDDRITCPACAKEISVLARRCPHCTTAIETVAVYSIAPHTPMAKIVGFLFGLVVSIIGGVLGTHFDISIVTTVIVCIVSGIGVEWLISRHGLGRTLVTTIGDNQTSIKQR